VEELPQLRQRIERIVTSRLWSIIMPTSWPQTGQIPGCLSK